MGAVTWLWRHVPHRHRPWHPGPYELWYCRRCNWALCDQGWLPAGDRHRWVPYEPREREWPPGDDCEGCDEIVAEEEAS
jgi:hypothetical protein